MDKLSKPAENLEKRKISEKEKNKKIIELYIRAIIQLIFPGVGGAIEKALFANIDAARQQNIEDLEASIIEQLGEQQLEIFRNSNNIKEIVGMIQESKITFDNFIKKLSTLEGLSAELKLQLESINIRNDLKFSEVFERVEILEESQIYRKMFVVADDYFASNGKHLLDTSFTNINRFKNYEESYKQFTSSINNLLIISGKGGNGKTHFLKEINYIDSNGYTVLYTNFGLRDVAKAVQDELDLKQKYILVIDDADRNLEDLQILIALVKAYSQNIKLILTSRPAGLNSIDKYIYDANLMGEKSEIKIEDWSSDELIQLLQLAGVNKDTDELLLIAKMYPNPFLITWIGRNIQNKTTLTIENIRDIFVNEIEKTAKENIFQFVSNPSEFLVDLAIIIPFNVGDKNIRSTLATRYATTVQKIEYSLDQLVSNGILRRIGNSIRFNPDMKGDLFLFYYFENKITENKQKEIFDLWFRIAPEKVLINIRALSRYFNSSHILAFCSEIINEWIEKAPTTNGYIRINNLKLISYVSHLVPDETLNLLFTYLEIKPPKGYKDNIFKLEPSSDDFGPVLISLGWNHEIRKELLKLILLLNQNKTGTYDNFKPNNIIVSFISPLENPPTIINKTLGLLEQWLDDLSMTKVSIIQSALEEVLAGSHRISKSFINVFKMWEEVLLAREDVIEMREKAFQLLSKLFEINDIEIKRISIKIARTVGSSKMGRVDLNKIPLKYRIEEERSRLVTIIGEKIKAEKSFQTLSEIEDLFLHWYADETIGTSEVADYLISFPRSTEYIVFKIFSAPDMVVIDFNEIKDNAPRSGKWDWMFKNYFHKYTNIIDPLYTQLAKNLNESYSSPELIVEYLKNLEIDIVKMNPWNHPLIITEWVKINNKHFSNIRGNSYFWNNVPERFKREIEIEFSKQSSEHLQTVANELLSDMPFVDNNKLSHFLDALSVNQIDINVIIGWLKPIITIQNIDSLKVISNKLYFIFKNYVESEKFCYLIIDILEPFTENKLELIYRLSFSFDILIKNRSRLSPDQIDILKSISKKYLFDIPKLDYHTESIMYFSFFNEVEAFIDFLIYRFKKEIVNYGKYESIPVGGFHKLNLIIDSMEKFTIFYNGVQTIRKEISYGGIHFSDLNHNIVDLINATTGNQFVYEHLNDLIKRNDYRSSLEYLPYLVDYNKHIDTILLVTTTAISEGYKDEVIRTYSSLFSETSFGFDTEELNKRKSFFQKLSSSVSPGLHKKIIMDQIENIDQELKWMTKDDDYLTPRG